MNSNEITINGKVYVPKEETTTEQAQPEPTEGKLILRIEAHDLGEQTEINVAINGKGKEILGAWASASAGILRDMGIQPGAAFLLLVAEMKNGKEGEDSND